MSKLFASLLVACLGVSSAYAQVPLQAEIKIQHLPLGSGTPLVNERAFNQPFNAAAEVGDYGVFQAPQFMPYYPTAATIWPRVVEVRCRGNQCEGYESSPALGRGEYLFFKPVQIVTAPVTERIIERPVIIQVPALEKKINQ